MYLLSFLSFILSFGFVWFIKQRLGDKFLDIPNERSSHQQPTPRGGGLGFILAFAITALLAAVSGFITYNDLYFLLIFIPLVIVGVWDDLATTLNSGKGLPSSSRYVVQLIVASIAIYLDHSFPLPWSLELGKIGEIVAICLTIIGFTAMINFYNFMDGLDGLVAGCSVIQFSFLAIYFNQPLWWLLVTAILGFLWWNWDKAQIFMGDSGSTFLGATMAIALLDSSNNVSLSKSWLALTITFPLIIDAIYTLICRLGRKENIFEAHRTHLYQRLQKSGWSHSQVTITYVSINVLIVLMIMNFNQIGILSILMIIVMGITLGEGYLGLRNKQ